MWPARPLIVARPSAVEIMFRQTNGRSSGMGPGSSEATSTGLSPSARSGYRRVKGSLQRALRGVPGLDALRAVERQLLLLRLALAGDRLAGHRGVGAPRAAGDGAPAAPPL